MKCIQNIGNFGIRIKDRENKLWLRLDIDDKNDKGKAYLMRNDIVIKEANVKGIKGPHGKNLKIRWSISKWLHMFSGQGDHLISKSLVYTSNKNKGWQKQLESPSYVYWLNVASHNNFLLK